jgi:TolA-binding protein
LAVRAYRDYVAKFPSAIDAPDALKKIADLQTDELAQPALAEQTLGTLIQTYPRSAAARYAELLLARLYVRQNKITDAETLLKQIAAKPSLPPKLISEAKFALGELDFYNGKFSESIAAMNGIAPTEDASNDALMLSLVMTEGLADTAKNPQALDALKEYAEIRKLAAQKKTTDAIALAAAWQVAYPASKLFDDVLFQHARLTESADANESSKRYSQIVSQFPKSFYADKSLFRLAKLAETAFKDNAKAMAYYEQLLREYPRSFLIRDARQELRRLKSAS